MTTYQYDADNRLTSVNGVQYTWDNRGNLTGNGTFTYEYDGAGLLARARRTADGFTVEYTYNGDGLRVRRVVSGWQATNYTWDLVASLAELLVEEFPSIGYTYYVPGIGQWKGGAHPYPAYYLADGLGSVRQLVGLDGYVAQRYDYAPFGEPLGAEGWQASALRYTGEQWDADAGLLYLRARWLDVATGWLSPYRA